MIIKRTLNAYFICNKVGTNLGAHSLLYHLQKKPPEVLYKKVSLKISQNSQENTCARRVSFLIKLQSSQVWNFIKKETLTQMFYWEFCEILKALFLQNTSGRLLLHLSSSITLSKNLNAQHTHSTHFIKKLCHLNHWRP